MGMYLYDDADRKIGGVHAATNFRETASSITFPKRPLRSLRHMSTCEGKGARAHHDCCLLFSQQSSRRSPRGCRHVEDEDDDIDEGEESAARNNPIDYMPVNMSPPKITELPDSTTPFEDKRFMVDNKIITNDPWIHIGDLYPEGKTLPLLP
ncbi:hypothetical protein TcBrA4_0080740, partial [Trypanosoma cruzi]